MVSLVLNKSCSLACASHCLMLLAFANLPHKSNVYETDSPLEKLRVLVAELLSKERELDAPAEAEIEG